MNYTYLPNTPHPLPNTQPTSPIIILTVQQSNKKTSNLLSNPRVSLLVHDWVSHRSSFSSDNQASNGSGAPAQSSLADLLTNINTAAMSSISATMFGFAAVLESGSEEEKYYREVHQQGQSGGGESSVYVTGQESRIVVVRVTWARVADHRGEVRDWVLHGEEERWRQEFEGGSTAAAAQILENGI